jgi:hypothetical protein
VAVATLAPGLCGYDTLTRLPGATRAEFAALLAELCGADRVVVRRQDGRRAGVADGLVVAGTLGAALGLLAALPLSAPLAGGCVAGGALAVGLGHRVTPPGR